jgi:glycosyltransferase involved in cell wall biosynthesis
VLVGDGPYRGELDALRIKLDLKEIVEMPGAADQDQVLNWWQRGAIGVLTSDNEGMPVSLMEAAACGVPVVATAVGGVPELVQDGVTGLLVPVGDACVLATALKRLLIDGQLRLHMSTAARQRAELNFSIARQVDQLLALWSEVLGREQS